MHRVIYICLNVISYNNSFNYDNWEDCVTFVTQIVSKIVSKSYLHIYDLTWSPGSRANFWTIWAYTCFQYNSDRIVVNNEDVNFWTFRISGCIIPCWKGRSVQSGVGQRLLLQISNDTPTKSVPTQTRAPLNRIRCTGCRMVPTFWSASFHS